MLKWLQVVSKQSPDVCEAIDIKRPKREEIKRAQDSEQFWITGQYTGYLELWIFSHKLKSLSFPNDHITLKLRIFSQSLKCKRVLPGMM